MLTNLDKIKAKEINDFWGNMMPLLCTEECGELTQAISKVERARINNEKFSNWSDKFLSESAVKRLEETKEDLMYEIADMYIVLAVLRERYGLSSEMIDKFINNKLDKHY